MLRLQSDTKCHYLVHNKISSLDAILSQMYLVHMHTLYALKIRFNIIIPSTPRSPV